MAPQAGPYVNVACKLPHGLQIKVGDKSITLRGANDPGAIAGYGFTLVPEAFWDAWSKTYRNYAPVKKGLIFAQAKAAAAQDQAKEQAEIKTGLERLDPNKGITGIKPAPKPGADDDDQAQAA